jgi:hypothetical protein
MSTESALRRLNICRLVLVVLQRIGTTCRANERPQLCKRSDL